MWFNLFSFDHFVIFFFFFDKERQNRIAKQTLACNNVPRYRRCAVAAAWGGGGAYPPRRHAEEECPVGIRTGVCSVAAGCSTTMACALWQTHEKGYTPIQPLGACV